MDLLVSILSTKTFKKDPKEAPIILTHPAIMTLINIMVLSIAYLKKILERDSILIALLWLLSFLFFSPLFVPQLAVYYIPDYAISDLFNVNYALKDYLSNTLKSNTLPFIAPLESHGYPLLAESQIGALNVLNLLLYRFLPPALAFNLTYPISLGILGSGMYVLCKLFVKRPYIAFFCAVTYMFSGIVLYEIVHQGIFQALSFIPITTYFFIQGMRKNSITHMAIAGFLAAQQFLFGHFFVSMGQQLLFFIFFAYALYKTKQFRTILILCFWYGMMFVLISLPQMVQSAVFTLESNRAGAIIRGAFPLPLFLSLFTPFPFGNLLSSPAVADRFSAYNASPWEANLFMGYGSLLVGSFVIAAHLRRKISKTTAPAVFIVLLVLFFIFMLGDAPLLKSLTRIWFFNSIRSIYRMCIFVVFISTILIGIYAYRTAISKKLIILAISLQIAGGFFHFFRYFPTIGLETAYRNPVIKKYLKPHEAVVGIGYGRQYKNKLIKQGYNNVSQYLPLNSALEPHTQLMYNVSRCDGFYYSIYNPKRLHFFIAKIYTDTTLAVAKKVEPAMEAYFQLMGCNTIASAYPLQYTTPNRINKNLYLYTVPHVLPDFLLTRKVELVLNEQDILRKFSNGEYDPSTVYTLSAIDLNEYPDEITPTRLVTTANAPTRIDFSTTSGSAQFLYVRRLMYPGWHAYLDGSDEIDIKRANILYMGLVVPPGKHTIQFVYRAPYWKLSIAGMFAGYAIVLLLLFRKQRSSMKSGLDSVYR